MLIRTDPPLGKSRHEGLPDYCWMTWHPRYIEFAGNLLASGFMPRQVTLKNIRGCEPYEGTYDISLAKIPTVDMCELSDWGRKLAGIEPSSKMHLLRKMIVGAMSRLEMRRLFALSRQAVVAATGSQKGCLYSPVTPENSDHGFPLHSDRFITSRLLLVFDDVERDKSGASTFLARSELLKTLKKGETKAKARRMQVEHLLSAPPRRDSFDRLYSALYPEKDMGANTLGDPARISFRRGEGYLLDDRHWLHGRDACSGRVGSFRFHRLTF